MPEDTSRDRSFSSRDDFLRFRKEIALERRYIRTSCTQRFLNAVAASCKERLHTLKARSLFWRAQLGSSWGKDCDDEADRLRPHGPDRMTPIGDRAPEGRVNAKGIPCLYLATTPETAMSEVRPWIGSTITVAQFEICDHMRVVDCSRVDDRPAGHEIEASVWADINRAFSFPVADTDDFADYAATQVLAELFRCEGHQGVLYKSAFGADGYNIALFDIGSAEFRSAEVYEVQTIGYRFEKAGRGMARLQNPEAR